MIQLEHVNLVVTNNIAVVYFAIFIYVDLIIGNALIY